MRLRALRMGVCLGVLCMGSVALGGLSVVIATVDRAAADLPDHTFLADYVPVSGSTYVDAAGTVFHTAGSVRREIVPLSDVPSLVRSAFLAAEDDGFMLHGGIDLSALARAAVGAATGTSRSGASTITQQVAKNVVVGNERTLDRKIREALVALRMERDLDKGRILEIYLNEIYFGAGAYGIAAAARTYFDKSPAELGLHEAALLAGLPKAPSRLDPFRSPDAARTRRGYVLRRMVETGTISPVAARRAGTLPLPVPRDDVRPGSRPSWFADAASEAVRDLGDDVAGGDAVVVSTVDLDLQERVEAIVREHMVDTARDVGLEVVAWRAAPDVAMDDLPSDASDRYVTGVVRDDGRVETSAGFRDGVPGTVPGDVLLYDLREGRAAVEPDFEAAVVVMEAGTGRVLVNVGGFSRERGEFDRARLARRQPGSAFKPIVYAAALDVGYDARSPLLDAPIAIDASGRGDWRPKDARTAQGGGLITVREALERSRNAATVRILWDLGMEHVSEVASRFGFDLSDGGFSAALGTREVGVTDLAAAYATFVNGGMRVRPTYLDRVEDKAGSTVWEPERTTERILDPVVAAQMSSILAGVPVSGTARRAFEGADLGFVGGKTGTTNEARDVWFVGVTGEHVVAVWMGRDDARPLGDGWTGGGRAAPLARSVLEAMSDGDPFVPPTLPPGASVVSVDRETGLPDEGSGALEVVRTDGDAPYVPAVGDSSNAGDDPS